MFIYYVPAEGNGIGALEITARQAGVRKCFNKKAEKSANLISLMLVKWHDLH